MQNLCLLMILLFGSISANSQFLIHGNITDEFGIPLQNVTVELGNEISTTNQKGFYTISVSDAKIYNLKIQHPNYQIIQKEINISNSQILNFILKEEIVELAETIIHHQHQKDIANVEEVNAQYLLENQSGSLAKSLEQLPGIQAMEIGSSTSKPIIRGMGFNRVAVVENGIKHEGQQWGADHGLEINSWGIENLEILKGAQTLEYGSDAMGGVLRIMNDKKPLPYSFKGDVNLISQSANEMLGTAVNLVHRKEKFYYKFSGNYQDFGDYSIPTDQIIYLSRIVPIFNEKLKNTAGNEFSASGQIGFISNRFENILNISNTQHKLGFFPGAHGIPSLDRVLDDGDTRNIDFPYQKVNHFKINNETIFHIHAHSLHVLMGYQNNHRQEFSEFHTHYGDVPAPAIQPDLELDFNLSTYDAQVKYKNKFSKKFTGDYAVQTQFQSNTIDGYGFLLPEFQRTTLSAFAIQNWEISKKWNLNFGIRFDKTQVSVSSFFDPNLMTYLLDNGYTKTDANSLAERSIDLKRNFTNLNYSAGVLFQPLKNWNFNFNISSSFRVPTAIELASNGIHHGSFRHEKGNPDLDSESGWTSDLKIGFHKGNFNFELNPYFYYFKNYIFLQPTGQFSPLPHAGQIYAYTQSEAFISGFEFQMETKFFEKLKTNLALEYTYNQQITENNSNYPLPFSPPISLFNEWSFMLLENQGFIQDLEVSGQIKWVAKQSRIAQNEEITDGYTLFGMGLTTNLNWKWLQPKLIFSVRNLGNTKYYNHMSFYRAIEIPEMGRNFQLTLQIPFGN